MTVTTKDRREFAICERRNQRTGDRRSAEVRHLTKLILQNATCQPVICIDTVLIYSSHLELKDLLLALGALHRYGKACASLWQLRRATMRAAPTHKYTARIRWHAAMKNSSAAVQMAHRIDILHATKHITLPA